MEPIINYLVQSVAGTCGGRDGFVTIIFMNFVAKRKHQELDLKSFRHCGAERSLGQSLNGAG